MTGTVRILRIMEHLRARRSAITASALAERFGVNLRTIYRDLHTIREAGIPLEAERGRGGGMRLARAYFDVK